MNVGGGEEACDGCRQWQTCSLEEKRNRIVGKEAVLITGCLIINSHALG